MKDGEIGFGADRSDGHAGIPEALPFERPMPAGGLGVGERSALEFQRGDDVIPGAQLMLAPQGCRLGPEQLLAGNLRYRSHRPSLSGAFLSPPPFAGEGRVGAISVS